MKPGLSLAEEIIIMVEVAKDKAVHLKGERIQLTLN